jgi:hypothetical protein
MSGAGRNLGAMNTEPQLIDPFLTDFVQRYSYRKQGAARARVRYLDRLLRWFLEETSRTLSCEHCQSLLDAERVLNPVGAYARVMDVDALMRRLLVFVHPPWLLTDPTMQVTQWKFVEALTNVAQEGTLCPCPDCAAAVANLRAHIDIKLYPNRR